MSVAETIIRSPLRGIWNGKDLIIDKSRVASYGEVLTPSAIVDDMLSLISKKYKCKGGSLPIKKTFLEPSCGTGNFLVQILQRKLKECKSDEDIFYAVSSIYGVDIQKDSVLESRLRMLELVESVNPDKEFLSLIGDVLEKNIVGGSTITDKRGCEVDGTWVKGSVSNATGSVEDDGITHDRLICYEWSWGSPVTRVVSYMIDGVSEDSDSSQSVEVDMSNLADRFKSLF